MPVLVFSDTWHFTILQGIGSSLIGHMHANDSTTKERTVAGQTRRGDSTELPDGFKLVITSSQQLKNDVTLNTRHQLPLTSTTRLYSRIVLAGLTSTMAQDDTTPSEAATEAVKSTSVIEKLDAWGCTLLTILVQACMH